MAEVKNFNQVGTVSSIKVKTGEGKTGKPWRLTSLGIKYNYNNKTTLLFINTFNIKENMPLDIGDIITIKGGILYNNSYKKGDQFISNFVVDCNYANIINETKHVVIQEESEPKVKEGSTSYNAEESSDVPF